MKVDDYPPNKKKKVDDYPLKKEQEVDDVDDYDYKFMQIADAIKCVALRVNLIGVAVEFSLPKSTHRTVKIIDKSLPIGIRIHFFADTREELPLLENVGDIVVLHLVLMQFWPQGVSVNALFNKNYSKFALFQGRGSLEPYQKSPNYKLSYHDKESVKRLRKWSPGDTIDSLHKSLFLREIKEGKCFNLLCKILHIARVQKNEWMLFLWDGTDTPPASVEAKLEDEMENPLPLVLEPSPLSRDILCTFPPVGTVLRMTVVQGPEKLGIEFLKTNRWVKFINLRCKSLAALWRAELTPSSKLYYLPDDDNTIAQRQRNYGERISFKWGRMPWTCFPWPSHITETDHPRVPCVTLMDVLTYKEVTYVYKCVVRVVAILPLRPEDFRSPCGIYRMKLTLEDPTARIHAYLRAEDWVKFFGNDDSVDVLTKKLDVLLGASTAENATRNPPWIQCCLRSYYIDKSDVWGSRNYRIFDTRFVG